VKLLRTIRLDPSDTFVFERAAEPGEWAVSGGFVFADAEPTRLHGKERSAFRAGFMGVDTLGWSTLVQIVNASIEDRANLVDVLAQRLMQNFGAPDLEMARTAAEDEVSFTESLCIHPSDTLIAVHRTFENGELREAFRSLRPRGGSKSFRAFSFLDVEGEEETPQDRIDLVNLAQENSK